MWHAYRDDALPQFSWEYAINSARMKRTGKNPQGFEPIPTSQIIFLHPGASLEWRDARKGSTDSRTKPAVYLEVLGINKWRWNEDTGAPNWRRLMA